jgi:hypothetical protein
MAPQALIRRGPRSAVICRHQLDAQVPKLRWCASKHARGKPFSAACTLIIIPRIAGVGNFNHADWFLVHERKKIRNLGVGSRLGSAGRD